MHGNRRGPGLFFRPSFMAMSRIGEPAEIVQTFYDLCNDEITPLIQRVVEAYGRVPEWLAKHLSALHLDKKSLLAAHTVLTACCNDDIGDLVGWMKPGKTKRRAFVWHKGVMNPQDMVILAQSLMMHGIIGKAKVRKLQRHETNEKPVSSELPITLSLHATTSGSAERKLKI